MILDKYISKIDKITKNFETPLFRGQKNSDWSLHSSATRRLKESGISEDDPIFTDEYIFYHRYLLSQARRIIPYGQKDDRASSLQILAKLQHFGAATGLLDFTWNPLVALWFASEDTKYDGKVFVIGSDLGKSRSWTSEGNIEKLFSGTNDPTGPEYWLSEPLVEGDAALRILGQRSVFVVGRPLISDKNFEVLVISAKDKKEIRRNLKLLDVSESSLYQDLLGFCMSENVTSNYTIKSASSYLTLGNKEFERGAYEEAARMYDRCIEKSPSFSEVYFLRGNANSALNHFEEAISDYDQALHRISTSHIGQDTQQVKPRPPWFLYAIHYNRGNMNTCLRNYKNAIDDYNRAIAISPMFKPAYFNCGNAYVGLGQFQDAIQSYNKVLELDANNSGTLHNKALALISLRKFRDAADCLLQLDAKNNSKSSKLTNKRTLEQIVLLLDELNDYDVDDSRLLDSARIKVTSPNYHAEYKQYTLYGYHGNTGNHGGTHQSGGEGFSGLSGLFVEFVPAV